jgi:hypothetical protein
LGGIEQQIFKARDECFATSGKVLVERIGTHHGGRKVIQKPSNGIDDSITTTEHLLKDSDSETINLMVEYMKEFLEKPHWVFQGLPVCPFARKARLENRILYKVHRFSPHTDFLPDSPVMRMISEFRQEKHYEVLLVVHPDQQAMTNFQIQEFIDRLNQKISIAGLIAFGGHPDEDFNIQGVHTRREPYLNFTVQSEQLVKDASDSLLKTDYYNNWTLENLKYVGIPRESNCS